MSDNRMRIKSRCVYLWNLLTWKQTICHSNHLNERNPFRIYLLTSWYIKYENNNIYYTFVKYILWTYVRAYITCVINSLFNKHRWVFIKTIIAITLTIFAIPLLVSIGHNLTVKQPNPIIINFHGKGNEIVVHHLHNSITNAHD